MPKPGPLSSTMSTVMPLLRSTSTMTRPDGPAARMALLSRLEMTRRRITGCSAHGTGPGGDVTHTSPGQARRQAAMALLIMRTKLAGGLPVPCPAPWLSVPMQSWIMFASHSACSAICSRRRRTRDSSSVSASAAAAVVCMLATGSDKSWHIWLSSCSASVW